MYTYLDYLLGNPTPEYSPMESLERAGIGRVTTPMQREFSLEAQKSFVTGQGSSLDFFNLVVQQQANQAVIPSKLMGGMRRLEASGDTTTYSPTQLQSMFPETTFKFKSSMSKTLAEREVEYHQNQEMINTTLKNFKSTDVLANLANSVGLLDAYQTGLGLAGTIVANIPDAVAESQLTAMAGAAIGSAGGGLGAVGGALAGSAVGIASKAGKVALQASRLASKTSDVLNVSSDIYRTGSATRRFFMESGVHAGIIENGVGSLMTTANELSQGASIQQAVKTAGEQFLTGLVASPVIDLGFKGLGKAFDKGTDVYKQYKIDGAINDIEVKRMALVDMPDSVFKQNTLSALNQQHASLKELQTRKENITHLGIPPEIKDTVSSLKNATEMTHSLNQSPASSTLTKVLEENLSYFSKGADEEVSTFNALSEADQAELANTLSNPKALEALDAFMKYLPDSGVSQLGAVTNQVIKDTTLGDAMEGKGLEGIKDFPLIKELASKAEDINYVMESIQKETDPSIQHAMAEGALTRTDLTTEQEQFFLSKVEESAEETAIFMVEPEALEPAPAAKLADVLDEEPTFVQLQFDFSSPAKKEPPSVLVHAKIEEASLANTPPPKGTNAVHDLPESLAQSLLPHLPLHRRGFNGGQPPFPVGFEDVLPAGSKGQAELFSALLNPNTIKSITDYRNCRRST